MPNRRRKKTASADCRQPLAQRLGEELELPKAAGLGSAHIEMMSNREAVVEGCRGVLEYNEETIKLNTGRLAVRFSGNCLCIRSLQCETAVICGEIFSVDFSS